jgi:hypothetical protein
MKMKGLELILDRISTILDEWWIVPVGQVGMKIASTCGPNQDSG